MTKRPVEKGIYVEGLHGQIYRDPPILGNVKVGGSTFEVVELPGPTKFSFIGMNAREARKVGVETNLPYHIVAVTSRPLETEMDTARHEIDEEYLDRYGRSYWRIVNHLQKHGMPYHIAHRVALWAEDKPWVTPKLALKHYKEQCKRENRQAYGDRK
jgi:hypothetical protein